MAEALDVASGVIAVVDMSAKALGLCSQYAGAVKNAKADIELLGKEVADFLATIQNLQELLNGPRGKALESSQDVCSAISDAVSTLAALAQMLVPATSRKVMSRVGVRSLTWPFKWKDVEKIIQQLARCRDTISLALSVDQMALIQNVDHKLVIDRLRIAEGASFDSHAEANNPTCLPNTRVELLEDVSRWIADPNSKTIFWLNGMAGTGKSTIARTVARTRSDHGDLGGSFFFKRGEADRGNLAKFIPTLARQLASRMPGIAPDIKNAIDADPGICGKTVREQFEKLIQEPLSKAIEAIKVPSWIVMVIDALDECERDEDIRLLIRILSRTPALRFRLRVFLTSRPELPIRLEFSQVRDTYQDVILHEIPSKIVAKDIQTYLAEEFNQMREDFNAAAREDRKLPPDWPGHESVAELTKMAVPLFIFAATLCRFIGERRCGSPPMQLRKVLDHGKSSSGSQFDLTYGPILRSQLDGQLSEDDRAQIIQDFRLVIGTIITLADPLSASCLSRLLDTRPDVVDTRLDMLHSVLSVQSDDSPVRLLHLSFRDYLVEPDQEATNAFWVNERSAHQTLAQNCLRVMAARLRENICGMSYPGMRRSAVDSQRIAEVLPREVQYACRFWAHHWTASSCGENDGMAVYGFFKEHLLHWVEAMSLLGRAREVIGMLRQTAWWIGVSSPQRRPLKVLI
ncbi:uncharacterized protein B0I36DRAFT_81660 [Microdochium trichocladiopsis]|uniref:NACHT domain-containing protein n=1 Tax=Microdochium trichocladiopsis TaxID=1682393 RepID=A0A9P9BVX6_9PEZI|nr:uncharacterized protein B0I36DRAFT_81660 [Microdochium trichocladiopsis]KAH7034501.1 hypothetical protein B0I36DRAFT_81660 [Microdochium trichocladiopsis]